MWHYLEADKKYILQLWTMALLNKEMATVVVSVITIDVKVICSKAMFALSVKNCVSDEKTGKVSTKVHVEKNSIGCLLESTSTIWCNSQWNITVILYVQFGIQLCAKD